MFGPAVVFDGAIAQAYPTRRMLGDFLVMGDQHHGLSFRVQLVKQLEHGGRAARVEVAGGLVGQQ